MSADLEQLFGDPAQPSGAFTHATIVDADCERRIVAESERTLDRWNFGAELVPVSLGGRWGSTEDMVRRLLPIFRRDPSLGLGYGITTLMAAANVWVSGDREMRARVAARLLAGERIATCFHELSHGNDIVQSECEARRMSSPLGGWKVDGRKEVINNVARAESGLLFVRTAQKPDPKSFSLLLWHRSETLAGDVDTSVRVRTTGLRGCNIGVARFNGLVLPDSALVGAEGDGAATALRAFQVTRAVIPALATGTVDAAIRLAVAYMHGRSLYGSPVWNLPHARGLLARAWGALLAADALARCAVRALHLRPDECFLASAAAKYLVPKLLNEAMQDLSVLFGSSFYAVDSPYGIVEKWLRDLVILPIGHAGATSCLLTLASNLPSWARRSARNAAYEPKLFSSACQLDELSFDTFRLGAGRLDSLTAPLVTEPVTSAVKREYPELTSTVDRLRDELVALRESCSALSPAELGSDASPRALALAARCAGLMAAGALLASWHEGQADLASPFRRSRSAAGVALLRLTETLAAPVYAGTAGAARFPAGVWSQEVVDAAAADVASAAGSGLSLGVEELPIAWSPPSPLPTNPRGT